jgi:hypothetical protein
MLPIHLHFGLPSGSFPLASLPITYTCSPSPPFTPYALPTSSFSTCIIILGEEYKSRSSLLCSFYHHPVTSSLFSRNILLSTLYSNTLSLCSSLNVRDHVSHPCRTPGKIIALYHFPFNTVFHVTLVRQG